MRRVEYCDMGDIPEFRVRIEDDRYIPYRIELYNLDPENCLFVPMINTDKSIKKAEIYKEGAD